MRRCAGEAPRRAPLRGALRGPLMLLLPRRTPVRLRLLLLQVLRLRLHDSLPLFARRWRIFPFLLGRAPRLPLAWPCHPLVAPRLRGLRFHAPPVRRPVLHRRGPRNGGPRGRQEPRGHANPLHLFLLARAPRLPLACPCHPASAPPRLPLARRLPLACACRDSVELAAEREQRLRVPGCEHLSPAEHATRGERERACAETRAAPPAPAARTSSRPGCSRGTGPPRASRCL